MLLAGSEKYMQLKSWNPWWEKMGKQCLNPFPHFGQCALVSLLGLKKHAQWCNLCTQIVNWKKRHICMAISLLMYWLYRTNKNPIIIMKTKIFLTFDNLLLERSRMVSWDKDENWFLRQIMLMRTEKKLSENCFLRKFILMTINHCIEYNDSHLWWCWW